MLREKMKSNGKFLVLIALFCLVGIIFLLNQNRNTETEKGLVEDKTTFSSKIETDGYQTFEDDIQISAVATADGPKTKYFNWKPKNPCPGIQDCYLSNITARVTFLNAGDPLVFSEEGGGYIQIANSKESNCTNPSQAAFTSYIAYSPSMPGGSSKTSRTCEESVTPNICNLSSLDGFDESDNCFSFKLFAQSLNGGEINFATHLISLTYTWVWESVNSKPQTNDL